MSINDPEQLLNKVRELEPASKAMKQLMVLAAGIGLFILLALFTYGLIHLGQISTRVDHNQQANTQALCALRADLQGRVTSSNTFLKHHPKGFPGVPAATIRSSIDNENRTIRALSGLTCPSH